MATERFTLENFDGSGTNICVECTWQSREEESPNEALTLTVTPKRLLLSGEVEALCSAVNRKIDDLAHDAGYDYVPALDTIDIVAALARQE